MKYVIVTREWCTNRGLSVPPQARTSLDGSKVLFHEEFIAPVMKALDEIESYEHDSKELNDILDSPEWTNKMEVLL